MCYARVCVYVCVRCVFYSCVVYKKFARLRNLICSGYREDAYRDSGTARPREICHSYFIIIAKSSMKNHMCPVASKSRRKSPYRHLSVYISTLRSVNNNNKKKKKNSRFTSDPRVTKEMLVFK